MSIDTLMYIGFGVLLVLLVLFIYFKDLESNRKFERFEGVIEDLNQQIHQLKQLTEQKNREDRALAEHNRIEIDKKIQDEINSRTLPIINSLKGISSLVDNLKEEQQECTFKLSQISQESKVLKASNEEQIIKMYNNGKNYQEIAKELHVSLGEVEFVLKIHNLL